MALLIGAEQKRFNYCDFPTNSSEKRKKENRVTEVSKIFVMWGIHGGHAKKFLSELVPFFRWPFNVKFSWLCTSWVVLHTAHAIPRKSTYFFFPSFSLFFCGQCHVSGARDRGRRVVLQLMQCIICTTFLCVYASTEKSHLQLMAPKGRKKEMWDTCRISVSRKKNNVNPSLSKWGGKYNIFNSLCSARRSCVFCVRKRSACQYKLLLRRKIGKLHPSIFFVC